MKKKGAVELSFGMIFSIILIIIFIAFAFFAIKNFLNLQNKMRITQFEQNFQSDIDKMWKSEYGSQTVSYILPSSVQKVCLENNGYENMIFMPSDFDGININNIDIAKITAEKNPFCIDSKSGKISFTLSKEYGEQLVTITK